MDERDILDSLPSSLEYLFCLVAEKKTDDPLAFFSGKVCAEVSADAAP